MSNGTSKEKERWNRPSPALFFRLTKVLTRIRAVKLIFFDRSKSKTKVL